MPATRTMTSRRAAARAGPRFGSCDDKRCLSRLERGPDLPEAGARAVSLERPEWVMAEARDLEQARQPFYRRDRKSTRLNSSHSQISYAVFCLKKQNTPNAHGGRK